MGEIVDELKIINLSRAQPIDEKDKTFRCNSGHKIELYLS